MWKPREFTENKTVKANILVFDVGSTYTKGAAFRLEGQSLTFLGRGQSPTTLEDVTIGTGKAQAAIAAQGVSFAPDTRFYSTCSAAGGLRMVALGYMPRVTAKAAKEVAMTAGARVMEVVSFEEPPEYREEVLLEIRPDIILLAGGTDGGDRENAVENARIIARIKSRAMVIVACNKDAQAQVAEIFDAGGIQYVRVPNIMPTIHQLNVKSAREAIHAQFIRQITKAKGLDKLQAGLADKSVMPTPGAVLLASELLARGTHEQEGVGGLMLVDIGGATTDIHSALPELEELALEERGLVINNEKHFSYRTVEGNLGMRVSATGILEAVGPLSIIRTAALLAGDKAAAAKALAAGADPAAAAGRADAEPIPFEPPMEPEEVEAYTRECEKHTDHIAGDERERLIDEALASSAVAVALRRHAGHLSTEADPVMGVAAGTAIGRDLRLVRPVLAVGGVFTYMEPAVRQAILARAFANPGISLLPTRPEFYFDTDYNLYAMGVLSQHFPDAVLTYLKNKFEIRGA